ncbi:uncharacterized protein LOC122651162 [Telopea speciosissima]|uniref:uncharacterized protein LOC122651162 n=1 Tax=Telopea speciosissima TaxID=54955 RepID=UPI001CC35950|nr:uncharacterized protein LOC122651162 [Telopea speciosissima]
MDLLSQFFSVEDREAIEQIRLSINPSEDVLCWGGARNGIFTIKSAYHLLCNQHDQQFSTRATSSHRHAWEDIPSEVWKRIWNIKTLPKVKNFLWRCCANGVASSENLMKRHIPIDPSCSRCGHDPKSIDHLLFLCPIARAAWFGSNLTVGIPVDGPFTLAQLLLHWPCLNFHDKRCNEDVLCLLSFMCWNIWLARNDLVFGIKDWTPEDIISQAQASSTKFLSISRGNTLSVRNTHEAYSIGRQSSPPDSGIIKINCDAAFSLKAPASGIGVVLRDHLGNHIQAASNPISFHEVLLGEALAVLFGLQLATYGGFNNVHIESDNEDLVSFIREPSRPHPLSLRSTLQDIGVLIPSFSVCNFSFISRDANLVAHSLARKALPVASQTFWPVSSPWLLDLCCKDARCFACPPLQ